MKLTVQPLNLLNKCVDQSEVKLQPDTRYLRKKTFKKKNEIVVLSGLELCNNNFHYQ